MKKIIVLGGSGQIGSVIVESLKNTAYVVSTSRRNSAGGTLFDPFHDDWTRLGKCDVIVNCVGQIDATASSSFYHIHVGLTRLLVRHRAQLGNPKIIQISALGASVDHPVEFLKTKGMADALLLHHPDTFVVRPSIVCTHRTMIVRKLLLLERISKYTGGVLPVPKGFLTTRIQPVMPEDLAGVVHFLSLRDEGERITNVVGPRPIAFHELVAMMFKVMGRKPRIIELPRLLTDPIVLYGFSAMLPHLINRQQYKLLFRDNTADPLPSERLLQRKMRPTEGFFLEQFGNAKDASDQRASDQGPVYPEANDRRSLQP